MLGAFFFAVLYQLLDNLLALVVGFPHLLLGPFLPQSQITLFALLQHLSDGRFLQKILHFTLIVNIPSIVTFFVVELYCSLC